MTKTNGLKSVTSEQVEGFSYNELIGIVRETNRAPGGTRALRQVGHACFLAPGRKVLEIGTSTGITAIELTQLTGCHITGIDINEVSLAEARERAKKYNLEHLTNFVQADASSLALGDESFDVVFCGNVTSLISNRDKAFKEYARVLRHGGLLAAIPMYYVKKPSEKLVQDVIDAIQVNIKPHMKDYWMDFFSRPPFKLLSCDDYTFDFISDEEVESFCDVILARPHLDEMEPNARKHLELKYRRQMLLFRDNLSHMGFSILVMRREYEGIDPELFTSSAA